MNNKQKEKAKTINIFGVDVESVLESGNYVGPVK